LKYLGFLAIIIFLPGMFSNQMSEECSEEEYSERCKEEQKFKPKFLQ